MILPASYANGFAPRDGRPIYPSLWKGCVGAWAPSLGPTGLTLRDWSGYSNHGTLTNMDTGTDWVASQGRYALDFDGVNDVVVVGKGSFFSAANFSISFWMKGNETPSNFMIPLFNSSRPGDSWNVGWGFYWYSSTGLRFFRGTYNGNTIDMTVTSPLAWNHVAATVRGVQQTLYLNGIQVSQNSSASASLNDGHGLVFGEGNSSTYNYACQMDAIAYHDRALQPQEVQLLSRRRGIAYELATRRRSSVAVAAFNRRRRLLVGAGS